MKKRALRETEAFDPAEIGANLWAIVLPILIGVTLGAVAILLLRRFRLRWTWALPGLPLAYLLASVGAWKAALVCGLTSATAAGIGAYWHGQDHYRGGEDARLVREAIGPLHALRFWRSQRRAPTQRVEPARRSGLTRHSTGPQIALGTTSRGGAVSIPLGISTGIHALVLGATGAGKTVTQAAIAQAHILAGLPAIVLDPKGDRFLRETLRGAAERMGVPFRCWSPQGSAVYNPFARGGPTEVTDKALAGHEWTEPHYELATQRLLLKVTRTLRAAGKWPPTLSALAHYMDPEQLDLLATGVGGETADAISAYVDGLSARAKADLGGGRDRLSVLAEGELGPLLDPGIGAGPEIDLAQALRQGEVVYFHIDADRFPAASKLLGAALVIDLVTLTAEIQGGEAPGLLLIDEFAALAADQVSRLFGRARSAGLSVLLGTQSLADLRAARLRDDSDTLTEQVLTNVSYAVVHREADPDSAERLARMAGTRAAWVTTEKFGGRADGWLGQREGTRTREREFIVLPDQIKSLGVGRAVLIQPATKTPGQVVRIFPPLEMNGHG
jgi:hypothetical protein